MIATVEKTICSLYVQCYNCEEWVDRDEAYSDDDGDRYCYTCYCDRYMMPRYARMMATAAKIARLMQGGE